jgi:hypothetical protein
MFRIMPGVEIADPGAIWRTFENVKLALSEITTTTLNSANLPPNPMRSEPLQQAFWDMGFDDKRVAVMLDQPMESELWPQIERALLVAMSVETCNVDLNEVTSRIGAGELGVMVCLQDDLVTGMAVLDEQDSWIDIPFLWSAGLPSLNGLFDGAERLAKDLGQKGIKWCTANPQAISYAKKRGHRQRQIEFVKEV